MARSAQTGSDGAGSRAAPRRVAVVVGREKSRGGRVEAAVGRLRDAGVTADLVTFGTPRELDRAIRGLGDAAAEAVVIGGGDGTLNAAAPALVRLGRPVGVLPLGTANDLARTLGIPLDPAEAGAVIAGGTSREIDLGRVNGRYFFNVASIGLSVTVARRLSGETKRRFGPAGYPIAALDALRATRAFRAILELDGERLELDALQVAIGNGPYHGGGMTVADEAAIDDGLLHVYALEPVGLARLAASAPLLRRGRHDRLRSTHLRAGSQVRVETRPRRSVNTDGEITTRTPADCEVVPRALAVLAPPVS